MSDLESKLKSDDVKFQAKDCDPIAEQEQEVALADNMSAIEQLPWRLATAKDKERETNV